MSSPAPSERSLESGEWNDEEQSFYFDTHPTPYESFDPDQSFEGYRYIFSRPRLEDAANTSVAEPLGSATAADALVESDGQQKTTERAPLERRCFNCGESDHAVAQCPQPRNRERIRQSRLEFEESKAERGEDTGVGEINGHARLHEQVASAEQRLGWLDEFTPGKPSQALIQALTWNSDQTEEAAHDWDIDTLPAKVKEEGTLDLPYLRNMLIWGYPPGWISDQDPIEQIRQRIQQDTEWESVEVLDGFDVAALQGKNNDSKQEPVDNVGSADAHSDSNGKATGEMRRWVDYQTHLFDSNRLQTFDTVFRAPLPQMQRQERIQLRSYVQPYQSHWESADEAEDRWWSERETKRQKRSEREDDRTALWHRLLSERSPSPAPPRKSVPVCLDRSRHLPTALPSPPPPPVESPPSPPPPPSPPLLY